MMPAGNSKRGHYRTVSQSPKCLDSRLPQDLFGFLAITPAERPDIDLALAWQREGAAAAVDLGRRAERWPEVLAAMPADAGMGIRIPDGMDASALKLPSSVAFLIVDLQGMRRLPEGADHALLLVQVTSSQQAEMALAAGARGLIAKGAESGGTVGMESAFILLQRVLDVAEASGCPVWCQGGMGLATAAGAFAAGAFGVVFDSVLAVYPESCLPASVKQRAMRLETSDVRKLEDFHFCIPPGQKLPEGMDRTALNELLAEDGQDFALSFGQDAALAKICRAECASIHALLRALRLRVVGQFHQARQLGALDEHSPWATAHGTRLPIAQGPMTRVSDTAAFANEVAREGGLPFLALAMMDETQCRALMESTSEMLAGKPWGVGILGFSEEAVLAPQMALIKELKPSVVLIAGARPSQARELAAQGITAYVHAPSPELLEMFLAEGLRHFIFEGRECGGHVGPRFSMVLWEQAIDVLRKVENPETLHLLFAGGIHDARSAATVAVIAAPLAALGARIGVLMGSAYIATREVVEHGAVIREFHERVLEGEATVILETSPGHAIRCLPSPFVVQFNARKDQLKNDAAAATLLEQIIVGRLRVASKGLARHDEALVPVEAEHQYAEGIYMIGQSVAFRHEGCTIAELHAAATHGAVARLAKLPLPAVSCPRTEEPIAIVGMACAFPGSSDIEAFWDNILQGRDLVGEVPSDHWDAELYWDGGTPASEKSPSKWGAFLDDVAIDPLEYGIPPQSFAAIDPSQLLALHVASLALEDAGYQTRYFDRERAAVIVATDGGLGLARRYHFRNFFRHYCGEIPAELDRILPQMTEDSFPGILGNVVAGRIANRLGLGGMNFTVDAACGSSLAALEVAVKELRHGDSCMVLLGGVDCHNDISDYLLFASAGALSPTGRCRPFDASADGIALGEGAGMIVLKRLSDAQRDNDRVYAVIEAVAGASDGKELGLTAPRKAGQKLALERTYAQAGVAPFQIGLVEAHGTGTVAGDRAELSSLTEVYCAAGALPGRVGLGSVKSQIGHTKCAAGIAGLIKSVKALHHRILPGTQQIASPNAAYREVSSPFVLNATALPWYLGDTLRAAVSSFGFGGTNFHAVVRSDEHSKFGAHHWPIELFAFRGTTSEAALERMEEMSSFLASSSSHLRLRDLAYTAWAEGTGPVQCAFTAQSVDELSHQLASATAGSNSSRVLCRPVEATGKVAWLFPGQGSQYVGMLRELFVYFPDLTETLADNADLAAVLFPRQFSDDGERQRQRDRLTDTRLAQPTLAMVEIALATWLKQLGLKPDMAAGHSFGEISALADAGCFSPAEAVGLARKRAHAIIAAIENDWGAMAAVAAAPAYLRALLARYPDVVIANENSPEQTVISGANEAMEKVVDALMAEGIAVRRLSTACAFHSPLIADAPRLFARDLEVIDIKDPAWPVYANVTAAPHPEDPAGKRALLADHVAKPVRFVDEIRQMHVDGARLFVEVGPRRVLTGLVGQILDQQPHRCIALDVNGDGSLPSLMCQLAQLVVLMDGFDATSLFAGRASLLDISSPTPLPVTTWLVNGTRAWPLHGQLPAHAEAPYAGPVQHLRYDTTRPRDNMTNSSSGDDALLSYLANMREAVRAQRDVMLQAFSRDTGADAPMAPLRTVRSTPPVIVEPIAVTALQPAAELSGPKPVATLTHDHAATLLAVVSERTGYPIDTLDLDLDLEADLSIDSIKRQEIGGSLCARLGILDAAERDEVTSGLSSRRNLRDMCAFLEERYGHIDCPAAEPSGLEIAKTSVTLPRFEFYSFPIDVAGEPVDLSGTRWLITDDGKGVAAALQERLRRRGAISTVVTFEPDTLSADLEEIDGLVHLATLRGSNEQGELIRFFPWARRACMHRARHIFTVALTGSTDAGLPDQRGYQGFMKTLLLEVPQLRGRYIELDPHTGLDDWADRLDAELVAPDTLRSVFYRGGVRYVDGIKPYSEPMETDPLPLDHNSVVLATGGLRGVTAGLVIALVAETGCRVELVGRSQLPADENAETRDITDPRQLRRALLERTPGLPLAEIEQRARRLERDREIRHNLGRLRALGADISYTTLDVSDEDRFAAFINELYAKHGRLDGVIHGAGIVEDKGIEHKAVEAFARVFDTKVVAAHVLRQHIRPNVCLVLFFSSISAIFGSRGQIDYSAANDALDSIAREWNQAIDGKVVTFNLGPWECGMVTEPVARMFERLNIGLLPLEEGVNAMLDVLRGSKREREQIMLMNCGLEAFGPLYPPLAMLTR